MVVKDKVNLLFDVAPAERITIQITKSGAGGAAKVGDLTNATWAPKPDDNGTSGGFAAPAAAGSTVSFGILFNFIPAPAPPASGGPDTFSVTISGSNGGSFPQLIFGPGFTTRTYSFTVV